MMNKQDLKNTEEELRKIKELYQETLFLAKRAPHTFLELQDKFTQIKALLQKCTSKHKEATAILVASKDSYKDEELYEHWTIYRTSLTIWKTDWTTKIQVFIDEKKPYTIDFLDALLTFLNKIKGEAVVFIKQYELLKEELSPSMRPKFDTWKVQTETKLNDPKQGWMEYIRFFTEIKAQRISDNAMNEKIQKKVTRHAELVKIWREESSPNIRALLVTEENVKNTQELYDNIQALKTLLEELPVEFKEANEKWYQICLKEEWAVHLKEVTKGLADTKERDNDSALVKGNPELVKIKNKDLKYIEPNKKIGLYKQGKKDDHKIAANDVKQGDFNDCFVLSPIAALADTDPSLIEKMIKEKKDGSFEVTLHVREDPNSQERTKKKISVKREFVIDQNGNDVFAGKGDRELWVKVLEKAVATIRGGFDGIDGGSSDEILQLLTGKKVKKADFASNDLDLLWGDLVKAYKNKKAANFSSLVKPKESIIDYYMIKGDQPVYYGHNYYLDKIDKDKIWLNNPHGKEHLVLTKESLGKYFLRYYILD